MLTREVLLPWVRLHYGWRHAEARIRDAGFAFLVDTQPDAHYEGAQHPVTAGNGPTLVLKSTGAFFYLSSNPQDLAVYQVPDEQRFREALRSTGRSAENPSGYVPTPGPVTEEQVRAWLRTQTHRAGDAIYDAGFGYWVDSLPGEGGAMTLIVKHNGAVWTTTAQRATMPLRHSRTEEEFHEHLRGLFAGIDERQPTEWLPALPPAGPATGLTRERVVEWAARVYGPRHADRRVTDAGFGYWVNTQPDAYLDGDERAMTYGNGPTLIMKSNGAIWYLASNPDSLPLYTVTSEKEFYDTYRRIVRGVKPENPDGWLP